jgi:hypothetical protein
MVTLSVTRLQKHIIEGAGRNVLWLWIPVTLLVLLGTWISFKVQQKLKGQPLMETFQNKGWGWPRALTYFVYGLLFWGLTIYLILNTGDFMGRTLLQIDFLTVAIIEVILTCIVSLFPVESLTRYAHLTLLIIIPVFIIISVSTVRNAHWAWIYPNIYTED